MLQFHVSDLRQYLFCPRVVYYQMFLPARPVTRKMVFGSSAHVHEQDLERRRSFRRYGLSSGLRVYHRRVSSETLGLSGVLDLLIKTDKNLYPVEYKYTFHETFLNAKVQLAAYAMMLEEETGGQVRVGFVYSIPNHRLFEVQIDDELRNVVRETVHELQKLAASELRPAVSSRPFCSECEFRCYCRDVV